MLLITIIIIIAFVNVEASLPNDCEPVTDNKSADAVEKMCMGLWYAYGGNKKCDNCCLIRNFTQISPGLIKKQLFIKKGQEFPQLTIMYSKRQGESVSYIHQSSDETVKIVGVDCKRYGVVVAEDKLFLYTREKDPSDLPNSIDGFDKCGSDFYKYNPKENCVDTDFAV